MALSTSPRELTKELLKKFSSRRMRDVLEKRFGLKGGRRYTLEAIGKEYKITRERVRQIEADALKQIARPEHLAEFQPVFQEIANHIQAHGDVMAEHHLFATLADSRQRPSLALLLETGPRFVHYPENKESYSRWTLGSSHSQTVEGIMSGVIKDLQEVGHPLSLNELRALVNQNTKKLLGTTFDSPAVDAYIATSKLIRQNPYGEYGLTAWYTINPRGIKDKAYLVLQKSGKALHFREVASGINKVGWTSRKAHPQTVHNELIKDPRFVLVGRGLYALREWGYEPGVVRDVLVSVMKEAGRPLAREEVVQGVLSKRFVKEPTILLNLQNRSLFRKTDEGRYTLV